jgi:putative ABC transport system permease protein
MLRNYFVIAFRNLRRNKVFSFINIFGLAVGLATCLLILLYIQDETGYDTQHQQSESIYRAALIADKGNNWAAGPAPLAAGMKENFPEVEQVARLLKFPNMDKVLFQTGQEKESRQFFETNGYYVDSSFFQLFTYSFVYGNAVSAMNDPNSLVLSEDLSAKLFGQVDPIGKVVRVGLPFGDFDYTVKAVFRSKNLKSHIPAHFFLSMKNNDVGEWVDQQHNWATNNIFHTYLKLKPGTDAHRFEKKLNAFIKIRGEADFKAVGTASKLTFLQPVRDIYLHSSVDNEIAPTGNINYLYILGSVALFILFIACINFMNLSTARSAKRAREVGVRKVIGAGKASLIRQFLGESIFLSLMALAAAILIAQLCLPLFNQLTQKNLHLLNTPAPLLWMAALSVLTGVFAGLYPAFYLSAFKPISVLKGKIANSFSALAIRKGLVVFQFAISVCLILGAIIIWKQLHFLENQELGFKKDQQIILPLQTKGAAQNFTVLKNQLLKDPNIQSVTSCSSYPGIQNINDMLFYAEGKTAGDLVDIHLATVENDFFKTLDFELLAGRPFSGEFTADSASLVLNETAVRQLGYEPATAIGKEINYDWENQHYKMKIVGVVKNFHYESLHHEIKPFGFSTLNFFGNKYNYLVARTRSADYSGLLSSMRKSWQGINPAIPFEYSFLDQDFQKNYEKEQRSAGVIIAFTCIAIVIACLGLFGLAAFSAEQRTREIGIRKVLGAGEAGIVAMLSKDYVKLILLSFLVAFPAGWWIMHKWLQNFAYRVPLSWWMFALAGGIAIFLTCLTVSYQSLKVAFSNPVKSLKSE